MLKSGGVAAYHSIARRSGRSTHEVLCAVMFGEKRITEDMPQIFVLADTHNKLPHKVIDLAAQADEVWHLGDVCAERILDELRAAGPPVTVVRGNCDSNYEWPLVVDLARGGLKFRLQHIPPERPPKDVDILLHGHTHVPRNERRGGVLFLNPGCVTRPNRGSPATAAWLEINGGKMDWRLVALR
jgi:putative phosphoesterase